MSSYEVMFSVAGRLFAILGMPGTTDTTTAIGWRRKYAPEYEIQLVRIKHGTD